MNGIIIIDKPEGKTSHDVVSIMRRITHQRRVGHTGTLDPLATGVLPICIGNATKVCDMLTLSDKAYIATVKLGITTDTQDITGSILTKSTVKVTKEQIEAKVISFIGDIKQIPPMYSAIKRDGKKLYELARAGIEVEREARNVRINYINILSYDLDNNEFAIEVGCSKGTYIRTLCEDIGTALGTGACMKTLRRIKTGPFGVDKAYTLDEVSEDNIESLLIATDSMFLDLTPLSVSAKQTERVKNGVSISHPNASDGEQYRVYGFDGEFLCVSCCQGGRLKILKTFW